MMILQPMRVSATVRSAVSACSSSGTVLTGIHDVSCAAVAMESCDGEWCLTLLTKVCSLQQ
jgi:hypothetical protein